MNYSVWIGQLFTSELIHILIEFKNLTSHFFLSIHGRDAHGLSIREIKIPVYAKRQT